MCEMQQINGNCVIKSSAILSIKKSPGNLNIQLNEVYMQGKRIIIFVYAGKKNNNLTSV